MFSDFSRTNLLETYFFLIFFRNLVGLADLNEKNLKLQGYEVISISPFSWNSMNMTVRGAKNDYLQKVLIKKKELLEGVGID